MLHWQLHWQQQTRTSTLLVTFQTLDDALQCLREAAEVNVAACTSCYQGTSACAVTARHSHPQSNPHAQRDTHGARAIFAVACERCTHSHPPHIHPSTPVHERCRCVHLVQAHNANEHARPRLPRHTHGRDRDPRIETESVR